MDCLFFDYDGTLYVDGAVSEKNRAALARLRQNGHKVFLNTGRSRGFVPESLLSSVEFDGLCCGSVYCTLGDEVLYSRLMPLSDVATICRQAEKCNMFLHLEGHRADYTFVGDRDIPENAFELGNNLRAFGGVEGFLLTDDAKEIAKISFVIDKIPEGFDLCGLRLIQMNGFIEGVPDGYTKATPMAAICERLSLSRDNVIAFGDSLNDEDMLAFAGRAAVMPSAPAALDKYNPYRARSHKDGVAEAICHFYGWSFDEL